ncbi:hypothetical protein [Spongiactinospora gelatinilytica]|uniref:hypothetical protein n=1 Tax=Spongiactinospora gelatinilytica TaxID=2666298 RepID=UPI0011B94B2A|nr:hypothetical protein [Spongiactinospora gelatinilytica]
MGDCFCLMIDPADVGFMRAPLGGLLALAAGSLDEMTDGMTLPATSKDSLFSIDVEHRFERRWIETTLIGEWPHPIFEALRC